MRVVFTRWLLLTLAVTLTFLGRPEAQWGVPDEGDSVLCPDAADPSMFRDPRRIAGIRAGTEQSAPRDPCAPDIAALVSTTWYRDVLEGGSIDHLERARPNRTRTTPLAAPIRGPPIG